MLVAPYWVHLRDGMLPLFVTSIVSWADRGLTGVGAPGHVGICWLRSLSGMTGSLIEWLEGCLELVGWQIHHVATGYREFA